MDKDKVYTKEEVTSIAKSLIGKTFGELKVKSYEEKLEEYNKGSYGHILEEDVYGYGINSNKNADFEEAGIELKVTPYKKNKNGTVSAKERLVITIINFMEDYKYDFYDSHLYDKSKYMQIVWYLWEENKLPKDFLITNELLYSYPDKDLPIILNDYKIIIDKIKEGKADEISEADTMYLGACTKGANAKSFRTQPFSEKKAKQRAFCLKTSYMTQLVRTYIGGEKSDSIIDKFDKKPISFDDVLIKKLKTYYGKSELELRSMFNVKSNAKNVFELLVAKMLGIDGKISKTDEFLKANITPKFIRVEEDGRIIESMSFPCFEFDRIAIDEWEDSETYEYFSTTKFMFVVFKMKNGVYCFDKIMFWNMPLKILNEELKSVWEKTKEVVLSGNIVSNINERGIRFTNFPTKDFNDYCHVRPHTTNSSYTNHLPVKDNYTGCEEYTKHCFWLNNTYVMKLVGK